MDDKMQSELDELRKQWEGVKKVIAFKESLSAGCYVSMVIDDAGWINVFRYFFIGDSCQVSGDFEGQNERKAWLKFIENFN